MGMIIYSFNSNTSLKMPYGVLECASVMLQNYMLVWEYKILSQKRGVICARLRRWQVGRSQVPRVKRKQNREQGALEGGGQGRAAAKGTWREDLRGRAAGSGDAHTDTQTSGRGAVQTAGTADAAALRQECAGRSHVHKRLKLLPDGGITIRGKMS